MALRPPDEALMGLYTWIPTCESHGNDNSELNKSVDIIAVQGLGASPYYTWVEKVTKAGGMVEEVMWLRDLLPEFVPNARIATFSYRSDWYTYKKGVKTSIRELGEQLLAAVHHDRLRIKASQRPIIFIGHSMGGLVIEQALVLVNSRPNYKDIKTSTAGFIALGTPHEGTPIAGYATFLATVKRNDPGLVKQLEPKEQELYNLSHDFAAEYKHLSITCFYEKLDDTYLGGQLKVPVVDQSSAVPGGREMLYLSANHSGLNKFLGVDDPNFKLVRDVIAGMVEKASEHKAPRLQDRHFMVFRRPNPLFTGRKDELGKLEKALSPMTSKKRQKTKADIYVIYGMGGAGKSEVALNFAYDHRPDFWGIFWVDARSEASISTGFSNIAQQCGLGEGVSSALTWLQDTPNSWLLILDNADDPKLDLCPYLPAGVNGSILITSRVPDSRRYENAGSDPYERLDEEVAVELLLKSCGIDLALRSQYDISARVVVVDLLGCHALAVIQAGAAISHGICKLEEYESMFLVQRRALLEYLPNQAKSEYGEVYTTFEVSATYLEGSSDQVAKDALQLLSFHAFMHFSDFPEEAFEEAWKNSKDGNVVRSDRRASDEKKIYELDPWHRSKLPDFMRSNLYNKELDKVSLRKARAQLASLSLISIEQSKGMTRIHPVTHAWSRDRLKNPKSADAWLNALAVVSLSFADTFKYHPLKRTLQPHLESLSKRPSFYDNYKDTFGVQQSLYRIAYVLNRLRNRPAALEMIQLIPKKSDAAWIKTRNGQEIQYLEARLIMGLGDLERAKELLEEVAKAQAESSRAEDHLEMGVQRKLARMYLNSGETTEAIEILERNVESTKRLRDVGEDSLSLLSSQHELGCAYYKTGDLEKAKTLLEQVVRIDREILKAEDPSRLSSEYQLARVYIELGDLDEATRMLEHITQTRSKYLKPDNPSRLRYEYKLAICYYDLRRYEESLSLTRSIEGRTRNLSMEPLAEKSNILIHKCLEAIDLGNSSAGDENLRERPRNDLNEHDDVEEGEDAGSKRELFELKKKRFLWW